MASSPVLPHSPCLSILQLADDSEPESRLPEKGFESRVGAYGIDARVDSEIPNPGRLLVIGTLQPVQPQLCIPQRDIDDGDMVGGDMPAGGRLCQASERCARFALHSRPGIGMTQRGQIEQTASVYGQRSFGFRDALLELAGLLVRPPEVPVSGAEVRVQLQCLPVLHDRFLILP